MGCHTSVPETEEMCLADTIATSGSASTRPALTSLVRHHRTLSCSVRAFDKVRSATQVFLKDNSNYPTLMKVLETWEAHITRPLEREIACADDLRTAISLNCTGDTLELLHEVDGLRSFQVIKDFAIAVSEGEGRNSGLVEEAESYLLSLSSLTSCFYLRLGPEIDWGLGVKKPLDRNNLSSFMQHSHEKSNLLRWNYSNSQPIPISFVISCVQLRRVCTFYSFDSHKYQNFSCAFSLFDHFGVPLDSAVQKILLSAKCEEVNCSLELVDGRATEIAVSVTGLEHSEALAQYLDLPMDDRKWKRFRILFETETVQVTLSPAGLAMSQFAQCSSTHKVTLI